MQRRRSTGSVSNLSVMFRHSHAVDGPFSPRAARALRCASLWMQNVTEFSKARKSRRQGRH